MPYTPLAGSPRAVLNVPAVQGMQLEDASSARAVEYVPAAHGRHGSAVAPTAVPYLPAPHAVHASWTVGVLTPLVK